MMNVEFIKHIVLSELKWKQKYISRSLYATIGALVLMFAGGESVKQFGVLIFIFGGLLPIIGSMQSSILPPMANQINQTSQSGSFSWKYLHSVIHDRKSFIFAYVITGIISSLPTLVFAIGALVYYKQPFYLFFVGLIPFLLIITFFKLTSMSNVIQMPRRVYFRYNPDDGIIAFFVSFSLELLRLAHFAIYAALCFLFVKFFYEFNILAGAVAVSVILIVTNLISYDWLLKIWADERLSIKKHLRELKKISIYLPVVIILGFINNSYHGYIIEGESDLFANIKDGDLEKLKQFEFKKRINTIQSDNGRYLIHEAVYRSKPKILDYLISKGADLESKISGIGKDRFKYRNGMTPLMVSIDIGNDSLFNKLLNKGSDYNAKNVNGMSAFQFAVFRCNPVAIKALYKKGVDINAKSDKGYTAYHYAVQGRCLVGLKYLKSIKADESLKDSSNMSYVEFSKKKHHYFYKQMEFNKELNNAN